MSLSRRPFAGVAFVSAHNGAGFPNVFKNNFALSPSGSGWGTSLLACSLGTSNFVACAALVGVRRVDEKKVARLLDRQSQRRTKRLDRQRVEKCKRVN